MKVLLNCIESNCNVYDVYCTMCTGSFSVSNGSRSDINDHLKTKKNIKLANELLISSVRTFFTPLKPNESSLKVAAKEVTFIYHTIIHNQSFNSMTCTFSLIRNMFDEKKITAARITTRDIALNVIAPNTIQIMKDELKEDKFVSVLVNASNHISVKLVPVIVHYFSINSGVKK